MAIDYTAAVRKIRTRVQRYSRSSSSTLHYQVAYVNGWEIQRVAEDTKFFGQVVISRLNLKMRQDNISYPDYSTDDRFRICLYETDTTDYEDYFPYFYTTEVHTNENTNEKSITAYDRLYLLNDYTVADLNLIAPYTIQEFANAISHLAGFTSNCVFTNIESDLLSLSYSEGANLEDTDTILDCLSWIAEVLGAICYVNNSNRIEFRRLDRDGEALYTISKDNYITLKAGESKRLGKIIYATELGDNLEAETVETGSAQAIRNNAFLDNRTDRAALIQQQISSLGGLTIGTFEMKWRGNPNYVLGDKIAIERKDGTYLTSFLLDEDIKFDGSLSSNLRYYWDQDKESDDNANPSTIGEAIYQTYAKVDKINKEITLIASDVETNTEHISGVTEDLEEIDSRVSTNESNISTLQLTTNGITGRVSSLESSNTTNTAAIGTLQTYVDQLEIGGRNLLLDTNAPSLTKVAAEADRMISTSATGSVGSWIEINDAPINVQYGSQHTITATGSGANMIRWYSGNNQVPLEAGETYTFSCYAKITSGTAAKLRLAYNYKNGTAVNAYEDITNTEWKKYSFTMAINNSANNVWVYFGIAATNLSTVQLCGFKVEKGTEATDWIPAPEDVDYKIYVAQNTADTATENISSVTSRVSTLETNTSGISATVTSHTTSISTLTTDLGTAQGNISTLQTNVGTNTSDISTLKTTTSTQTTNITALQTALANLGTRNYFINTLNPDVTAAANYPRLIEQNANTVMNAGTKTVAEHGMRNTNTTAARSYMRFGTDTAASATMNGLEAGETYTLSFDAACKLLSGTLSNTTTYYLRGYLYTDTTTTGTLASTATKNIITITSANRGVELTGRCEWTFTIPANATMLYIYIGGSLSTADAYAAGDYIEMRNIQLEKGSVASDWNAAPEDYQKAIYEAETALSGDISNTQESIESLTSGVNDITIDLDTVKSDLTNTTETLTTKVNELEQQVNLRMTESSVELAIDEKLSNGVKSIETETGYRFDKDGLTISKSDSDISTLIDNTGMTVSNTFEDVLTATNAGVDAVNLSAKNFLIVGTRLMIRDFGNGSVGLFYIGD